MAVTAGLIIGSKRFGGIACQSTVYESFKDCLDFGGRTAVCPQGYPRLRWMELSRPLIAAEPHRSRALFSDWSWHRSFRV